MSPQRDIAGAVLVIVGVLGTFTGLWPVVAVVLDGVAPDPLASVAHISGMLAGYGVLVMLMLMSRWPVLERGIGADVL
ncbi:MAG TPA: hypothetical protein VKB14_07550, partial [Actinomycetales bacterium]|nr:hypothetical protein [Actinomycetales bacterium]